MFHELNNEHILFEEYCASRGEPEGIWYPEQYRYTVMSVRQLMWETWLAAKRDSV